MSWRETAHERIQSKRAVLNGCLHQTEGAEAVALEIWPDPLPIPNDLPPC